MVSTDYKEILSKEFKELSELVLQRQQIDLAIANKRQFIRATLNMLTEQDRTEFEQALEVMVASESVGLTQAIRNTLQANPREFYTANDVRKMLQKEGFDFSGYTQALASVHAILKRLKPTEVEVSDVDGVMAWRAKEPTAIGMAPRPISDLMKPRTINRTRLKQALLQRGIVGRKKD